MRIRVTLLTLALAAGFAAAAGAALAEDGTPREPSPEQIAARCGRAQQRLDHLNTLAGKLDERIAKIEAKIASGELTGEQLAKAQAILARLQERQTKLADRVEMLGGRIAEHCSGADTA